MTEAPRNDAAMAEILASMRRIVAESDQRTRKFAEGPDDPEVLVLTPEMRLDAPPASATASPEAARPSPPVRPVPSTPEAEPVDPPAAESAPEQQRAESAPAQEGRGSDEARDAAAMLAGAPDASLDEAAVADIVRAVLREEFNGAFGRSLTQQIRTLVQNEVARTLAARQQGDG